MTDEMITVNTMLVRFEESYTMSFRFHVPNTRTTHLIILNHVSRENVEAKKKHLEITTSKGRTSFIGNYDNKRMEIESARKIWNQIIDELDEYVESVTSY